MAINFFNNLQVNKGYIEIDDGGTTNQRGIISYGVNGKIGQTTSWTPDIGGNPGLWVEGSNDGESGGIFMNGNTCALWSPGDQGILKIYDEDNFGQGAVYQITGAGHSEGQRFASIANNAYYLDPDGDSQLNTLDIDDYVRHRGDTNTYIGFPTNDTFTVTTANSERVRVTSGGDVGIGTASNVDERLHVQGSVNNDDIAIKIENSFDDNNASSAPTAALTFQAASNNGYMRLHGAPADTAAKHQLDIGSTASSSYITFSPSTTEKMRISSAGNVGIGTITPGTPLHVYKAGTNNTQTIVATLGSNSTRPVLSFSESTSSGITTGMSLEYNGNSSGDNNYMVINSVANVPRFTVMSGGNVGIGTTSPSTKLHVNGGYLRVDNSGGSDNYYLEFYEAGAQRFRIYENNNNVYFDGGPGNTHFRPRQGGGTNNFVVTGSNVGFGTSTPGRQLVVQNGGSAYVSIASGATSGSYLLMGSSFDDDEAWILYDNNTNSMSFKVSGSTRLKLNSDGSIQQGNSSATGQYAAAFGQNNTANSLEAFATGENTTASGRQAFAGGFNTTASGSGSFAIGGNSVASGANSLCAGGDGTTTGATATSIGTLNDATGDYSFAAGYNSTASGLVSFAMGSGATASGSKATAFGEGNNIAGELDFAVGAYNTTAASRSYGNIIAGYDNDITSYSTSAASSLNLLTGTLNTIGISSLSNSSGDLNIVGGANNTVGFATIGTTTVASASNKNIVQGTFNNMLAYDSIAVGRYNRTSQGGCSATIGFSLITPTNGATSGVAYASQEYDTQFIVGRWNNFDINNYTQGHRFAVGNGTSDGQRFTAFNVLATSGNARVGIAKDVPAYPLDVTGTGRFTGGTTTSDERLKENIQDNTLGLSELVQLRTVTFDWKTDEDLLGRTMEDHPQNKNCKGLIAQEVEVVSEDLVETDDSEYEIKSINQGALTTMLIKAIQEQQDVIESLTERIQALENN